jgi:hypothetical protein
MGADRTRHVDQLPASPSHRDPVVDQIVRSLEGLRYGSIEVVIHDSRVVHIERRERVRVLDTGPDHGGNGDRRPRTGA